MVSYPLAKARGRGRVSFWRLVTRKQIGKGSFFFFYFFDWLLLGNDCSILEDDLSIFVMLAFAGQGGQYSCPLKWVVPYLSCSVFICIFCAYSTPTFLFFPNKKFPCFPREVLSSVWHEHRCPPPISLLTSSVKYEFLTVKSMKAGPLESVLGWRLRPLGLEGLWRLVRDGLEVCHLRVPAHLLMDPDGHLRAYEYLLQIWPPPRPPAIWGWPKVSSIQKVGRAGAWRRLFVPLQTMQYQWQLILLGHLAKHLNGLAFKSFIAKLR